MAGRGDGVVPLASPRVASAQPACRQPCSTYGAVGLECLERVGRAARGVPTRRWPAGTGSLVHVHEPDQRTCGGGGRDRGGHLDGCRRRVVVVRGRRLGADVTRHGDRHRSCREAASTLVSRCTASARWSRSVVIVAPRAAGRTMTRYDAAGRRPSSCRLRAAARSCRRRRLRTTAVPTVRGSANATAGCSVVPSRVATTVSGPLRARTPSARKRRKASRPLTRSIKQTACDGPCGAGP